MPVPDADAQEGPLFAELGLHPDLLRGIHDLGFIRPTPIQAKAIPAILSGSDVIGCAQTGTGKTAAFVLPILHHLMRGQGRGLVRSLIIAPTRELALQSMEHLRALSKYVPLKGSALFGGVPMGPQIRALERGVDIISATPGRLLDHIYAGRIDFAHLEIFVLDEVDRMLDMGFLPDIKRILRLLPEKRQTLVFSATLPDAIEKLTQTILINPVKIQVGQRSSAAHGVRQALYPVRRARKTELLTVLLKRPDMDSVLVFTRTKIAADRLGHTLTARQFRVSVLHGDRSQSQRLQALEQFRRGRTQVLVATDIAARGIDISDISHVINYDVPNTPEDYVHRIGRTARAASTGDALTLVDPEDEPVIADIERVLGRTLTRETMPGFDYGAPEAPSQSARHQGQRPYPSHRRQPGTGGGRSPRQGSASGPRRKDHRSHPHGKSNTG